MLQPDHALPQVPMKQAPWQLQGNAWIVALRLPEASPARRAFLPASLAGTPAGGISLLMFVDYAQSDCGPYHELLFIPGSFRFADGRRYPSISRILVSTWDSVVNGRANWGIPKDRADFEVRHGEDGVDEIVVRDEGRVMAELRLKAWPVAFPVFGSLVPAALRTIAQVYNGRVFHVAPTSRGWAHPGKLLSWRFDDTLFPDLAGARVLGAVKLRGFHMTFPVARVSSD